MFTTCSLSTSLSTLILICVPFAQNLRPAPLHRAPLHHLLVVNLLVDASSFH